MLKIGTKLRQLRDKHGYTQEQIAEVVNMSQGFLDVHFLSN